MFDTKGELMKVFETTPLGSYSSSPGAIYPALKKLKAAGLTRAHQDGSTRGQRHALSPAGKKAFRTWLLQKPPPGHDDLDVPEEMLRFTFMGDVLTPAEQAEFLDAFAEAVERRSAHLRAFVTQHETDLRPNDRLAMKAGLAQLDATIAWAAGAKSDILRRGEP